MVVENAINVAPSENVSTDIEVKPETRLRFCMIFFSPWVVLHWHVE